MTPEEMGSLQLPFRALGESEGSGAGQLWACSGRGAC